MKAIGHRQNGPAGRMRFEDPDAQLQRRDSRPRACRLALRRVIGRSHERRNRRIARLALASLVVGAILEIRHDAPVHS